MPSTGVLPRVAWLCIIYGPAAAFLLAQEVPPVQPAEVLLRDLQGEDLESRRNAAIRISTGQRELQQQTLSVLVELLKKEKDGQVRLAVLDTVTALGPEAASATEALVETFRSNYGGNQNEKRHQDYRAALALAAIGDPAVEPLRRLLGERREHVRAYAAMALGRIGPSANAAIDDLIKLLADDQESVRREAALALGKIGAQALEPLIAAAKHENALVRSGAITSLGMFPAPDERARQAIVEGCQDAASVVRVAAIKSIAAPELKFPDEMLWTTFRDNIRHDDDIVRVAVINAVVERPDLLLQLAPELSLLLSSESEAVSRHAAFLLQQIGPKAAPMLLDALRDDKCRIEHVADALAGIGRPIIPAILDAAADANPRVRQSAMLALGRILPAPPRAIEVLTSGLADSDRAVQAAVLNSIGRLGRRAAATVPQVRAKLREDDPETRSQAIATLFQSAPRDSQLLEDFMSLLDDSDVRVQREAIDAIRQLGSLGRRALPTVTGKLQSPDLTVRLAAANFIGSHGRAAGDSVPALSELINDPNPELRVNIIRTLGQLGAVAQPALPRLIPLLDDPQVEVRAAVAVTLASLDLEAIQVRPHLAKVLQDKEAEVRRAALTGVQQFGRRGAIFLPDLITLAAHEQDRTAAKSALRRFERSGPDPQSITELIALLKHDEKEVKLLAIQFLGLGGQDSKDALVHLESLIDDSSEEVRKQAKVAIEQIKNNERPSGRRREQKSA